MIVKKEGIFTKELLWVLLDTWYVFYIKKYTKMKMLHWGYDYNVDISQMAIRIALTDDSHVHGFVHVYISVVHFGHNVHGF
jgi:hypothetical protein